MRERKIIITDFVEDLNHRLIILYIGDDVDVEHLRRRLNEDNCGHLYRLDYCLTTELGKYRRFFYISNCDFQDLDYPVYDYVADDGFSVYVLHYDKEAGVYYYNVHC